MDDDRLKDLIALIITAATEIADAKEATVPMVLSATIDTYKDLYREVTTDGYSC